MRHLGVTRNPPAPGQGRAAADPRGRTPSAVPDPLARGRADDGRSDLITAVGSRPAGADQSSQWTTRMSSSPSARDWTACTDDRTNDAGEGVACTRVPGGRHASRQSRQAGVGSGTGDLPQPALERREHRVAGVRARARPRRLSARRCGRAPGPGALDQGVGDGLRLERDSFGPRAGSRSARHWPRCRAGAPTRSAWPWPCTRTPCPR